MAFRFEGLDIWQMAKEYAMKVYAATAKFPRHEDYGLRSQMNRAVNSINLNIAEGSAKSTSVAVGSTFEVVAAAALAMQQAYISAEEHKALYNEGQRLAKSINAFRSTLNSES